MPQDFSSGERTLNRHITSLFIYYFSYTVVDYTHIMTQFPLTVQLKPIYFTSTTYRCTVFIHYLLQPAGRVTLNEV